MKSIKKALFFLGLILIVVVLFSVLSLMRTNDISNNLEKSVIEINDQEFLVDVADNVIDRSKGLSTKESIESNEGMLFLFENKGTRTFWMKDMNFSIDIIWIDEKEIIGIEKNVEPEPGISDDNLALYSSPQAVDKVLEIKAGGADLFNINVGDEVIIKEHESSL